MHSQFGERIYSRDLTQGGLKIPCMHASAAIFEINNESLISKIKKMLDLCQKQLEGLEVLAKRIEIENKENECTEV